MGIGSIVLAAIAWLFVAGGFTLHTSHELSAVALMFGISGAAVAREGQRVEENSSTKSLRAGLLINAFAIVSAVASIVLEILRRRAG